MDFQKTILVIGAVAVLSAGGAFANPVNSLGSQSSLSDVESYLKASSQGENVEQIVASVVNGYSDDKVPVGVLVAAVESVFGSSMLDSAIPGLISAGADAKTVITAAIVSGAGATGVVQAAVSAGVNANEAQKFANAAESSTTGSGGGTGSSGPIGTPVPGGGGGGTSASPS